MALRPNDSVTLFNTGWGRFEKAREALSGDDYGHFPAMSSCLSISIFMATRGGRLDTMHLDTGPATGDEIWLVSGCPVPLMLRPQAHEEGLYELLLEANRADIQTI
jgi:hypothetical protein